MIDWYVLASFTVCGALLAMMAIGIAFSVSMPTLDRWSRRYFISFFSLLFLYVVVLLLDMIFYIHPDMPATQTAVVITEYLFFSVLTLMPMILLLHSCSERFRSGALLPAGITLWGLFCVMLLTARFTNAFYYVSPDGRYFRGPWFPLFIAPLALIMLLSIGGLLRRRGKLSKRIFIALILYLLPTAVMIIIYMFAEAEMIVAFWMVLSALTMFGLILTDNLEQYMRQQREIAHQRAGVMVLRMRPHFICNTMMAIYYLCDQDPPKAKRVTLDFTNYLRRNFTAIASEDAIPFHDELEHTRAYLAVEQAQFEDNLFVSFDTPHTMFRLPSLTLQPLVENAVKHGMKANGEPIHISVATRQIGTDSEIVVEDDGVGFVSPEDDAPQTTLHNIRQRLALMCGGKLEISPREGGGTRVKVTIPAGKRS